MTGPAAGHPERSRRRLQVWKGSGCGLPVPVNVPKRKMHNGGRKTDDIGRKRGLASDA